MNPILWLVYLLSAQGSRRPRRRNSLRFHVESLEDRLYPSSLLPAHGHLATRHRGGNRHGVVSHAVGRSVNGTNNNLTHPEWGGAGTDLIRIAPAAYADGVSAPAG